METHLGPNGTRLEQNAQARLKSLIGMLVFNVFCILDSQQLWSATTKPTVSPSCQNTFWDTSHMSQINRKQRNFQEKYWFFICETLSKYDKRHLFWSLDSQCFNINKFEKLFSETHWFHWSGSQFVKPVVSGCYVTGMHVLHKLYHAWYCFNWACYSVVRSCILSKAGTYQSLPMYM